MQYKPKLIKASWEKVKQNSVIIKAFLVLKVYVVIVLLCSTFFSFISQMKRPIIQQMKSLQWRLLLISHIKLKLKVNRVFEIPFYK